MSDKPEDSKKEIVKDAAPGMKAVTRDGFFNFLSRLGLNNDNTLSDSTYIFNMVTRNRLLLEAAYRGSWVVGAVIDSVADDMTRAGILPKTSEKEPDLEKLSKNATRLKIWESINTGIKWGRLYGGALGVIQIEGQNLATPLNFESVSKDSFKGLVIYDRWMLNPIMSPVIAEGPDTGLPVMYQIVSSAVQSLGATPDNSQKPGSQWNYSGIVNVHHTRVIRFTGILLPFYQAITEMFWGESVLERLYDRLISFDNASLSAAQLIDKANLRTIGVDKLREILAAGGEAQAGLVAMFEMMRLLQTNESLTLIDKEDEFKATSYSFSGLSDLLLQFAQQLSGATGIPLRRLFSQVPAGLGDSGDSDIRLYYDNINAQQEARLRSGVDILYRILWRSTFGAPVPEDFDFDFTPLWQMDAKEKADLAKVIVDAVGAAYEFGLINQQAAMRELRDSSSETGIFSNITEEDIKAASEELPPTPQEQVEQQQEIAEETEEKKAVEDSKKPKTRLARWLYGIKG